MGETGYKSYSEKKQLTLQNFIVVYFQKISVTIYFCVCKTIQCIQVQMTFINEKYKLSYAGNNIESPVPRFQMLFHLNNLKVTSSRMHGELSWIPRYNHNIKPK
jgi:hypothetical protein